MMPPGLAILSVMVALGGLLWGVRAAQRRCALNPELCRKTVHMGMGLVCVTFPWLFQTAWPVAVLAGCAAAALGAVRLAPKLRKQLGGVLGGVERESWGELLFPLSVAFVFWLAHGQALLFCIPVLTLTLADAMAALIGQRYGLVRYETDSGWKSVEGSTAFFFVAFLSTHVPLLLCSDLGRLDCLLIAVVMGLILGLMEAIAWRGLDNLFIPLVSYVCLTHLTRLTPMEIEIRLVVLLLIILGLSFWRKTTRLTQSAIIGAALILYVTWAAGDWRWFIAPLVTAAAYTFLCRDPAVAQHKHTIFDVACIGGMGLLWLCFSKAAGTTFTIFPYGVGYGANLGMIALAHFAHRAALHPPPQGVLKAIALGYLALATPYFLVWWNSPILGWLALDSLILVGLSVTAFSLWQSKSRADDTDVNRLVRQLVISALASSLAFCLRTFLF